MKTTLIRNLGLVGLTGLGLLSMMLLQACSDSSSPGDGGISGTGSPLESYLKNGMNAHNQTHYRCDGCETLSEQDGNDMEAGQDYSTTNTQEAGVDEADWIKTDGQYVYSYSQTASSQLNVFALNSTSGQQSPINSLSLDNDFGYVNGLYLHQRPEHPVLAVLAGKYAYTYSPNFWGWSQSSSELRLFDVSAPEQNLPETFKISIDGQFVSSRKINQTLYIVSQFSAHLDNFVAYPSTEEQRQQNLQLLNDTPLQALLPKISINGTVTTLLNAQDCYIPGVPEEAHQPTLAIVTAINLENPTEVQASCVAAPISTIYVSKTSVYLVENSDFGIIFLGEPTIIDDLPGVMANNDRSVTSKIYQIDISNSQPSYRAMAEVSGLVGWDQQFRLSEYDDHLRVVTSLGTDHQLHILAPDGDAMSLVSTLPNEQAPEPIGKPGESIYAVRFFAERAYIVTFRTTDPFYVLDLKDPAQPSIIGQLELPGFSSYLHPFSNNLVLGVGRDGERGNWSGALKMALFDVSTPTNPVIIDQVFVGATHTDSVALYNPKAIGFLAKDDGTRWQVSLPASVYDTNYRWQHDALYLLDITTEDNLVGAGMTLHGALMGATSTDDAEPVSHNTTYDRGLFKDDFVYYLYNELLFSENWLSDNLKLVD